MAVTKYIVISDCRIDGKHTAKGTFLDLDPDNKREGDKIALLNRSGRIGLATKANVDAIQAEIRDEAEQVKLQERPGRPGRLPVPA